jgi:hypothetical protein
VGQGNGKGFRIKLLYRVCDNGEVTGRISELNCSINLLYLLCLVSMIQGSISFGELLKDTVKAKGGKPYQSGATTMLKL